MLKIINPWLTTVDKKVKYFLVDEETLVIHNGDYKMYRHDNNSYLYTYKDRAFSLLGGINVEHLDRVATRSRPDGEYSPQHFLYDRAIETLNAKIN